MRALILRLVVVTALATTAAVTVAGLLWYRAAEHDRMHATAEADIAAIVSLAEATDDPEMLRRGIARTESGRDGRIAVHLGGATIGSSRMGAQALPADSEQVVAGGTLLLRNADTALVEVFVPDRGAGIDPFWPTATLLATGALAAAAGFVLTAIRVRPVVADLESLTYEAAAIGLTEEITAPEDLPGTVPETAALARELAAVRIRFAEACGLERRLAADLSHRLRTPLTALRLDAESLGAGATEERVRQAIGSLEDAVDVLIRGDGAPIDGPTRCDVVAVVQRRMAFWSALAQHGRRSCEVRTAAPPAVIALPEEDLAAVVDALLGNVFRYTPDGTAFAVSVFRHAGWITLAVDDAGPGVTDPAAALSRGASFGGGTGLGLDIAREAVEATGGTIHVERATLGGARIRLRFAEAA